MDSASRRQRGLLSTRTPSGQAATKFGLAVDQRGWPTLWLSKGYLPASPSADADSLHASSPKPPIPYCPSSTYSVLGTNYFKRMSNSDWTGRPAACRAEWPTQPRWRNSTIEIYKRTLPCQRHTPYSHRVLNRVHPAWWHATNAANPEAVVFCKRLMR